MLFKNSKLQEVLNRINEIEELAVKRHAMVLGKIGNVAGDLAVMRPKLEDIETYLKYIDKHASETARKVDMVEYETKYIYENILTKSLYKLWNKIRD